MANDIFFKPEDNNPFNGKVKIFYYTEIDTGDSEYKYPVYISFLGDTVYFRYFGYVNDNDGNNSLGEYTLFKLHLNTSPATQKKLDEIVRSLYDNSFPLMSDYQIPHENTHDLETPIRTYKDLECFSGTQNNERNTTEEDEHTRKIFYKNLLLDFLYTVKNHPEIFSTDKAFDQIRHLLNDAPILQAISAKAEFYFYKENYINKNLHFNVFNNCVNQNIKNFQNALTNWLSIVQKPDSSNLIKGETWFDDVETETRKVLENMPRIKKIDTGENNQEIEKRNNFINEFNKNLFKQKEKTLEWFISRNNIFRAWFTFNKFKLIFFILLALILYFVTNVIFKINFQNKTIINIKYLLLLILLILLYDIKYTKRYIDYLWTFAQFPQKKFFATLMSFSSNISKLFMFRLWWLIAGASYFVFELTSFYNKHFIENDWTYQLGFVILYILTSILIFKILYYTNKESDTYLKNNSDFLKIFIFVLFPVLFFTSILFYMFSVIFHTGIDYIFFSFSHHVKTKIFLIIVIISTFSILFNNDKKFHPNLSISTTRNKMLSMFFYGIIISFFMNVSLYNTFYKEYLERNNHLGRMWEHANIKALDDNQKKHHENLYEYVYTGKKLDSIDSYSKRPLSDKVKVYIDDVFYNELTNLYVYKKENIKSKKLFPVLKEIDFFIFSGIKIMPSVLFINTFLTLFVASFFQFLLHRKRFMEGGELE